VINFAGVLSRRATVSPLYPQLDLYLLEPTDCQSDALSLAVGLDYRRLRVSFVILPEALRFSLPRH
jgi:hypothetical protein